ncbi:helix-turn-helix transcriptional regulator [Kribbella shirazensis]|uniref:Putative DNA-binding transcriptional regulator YafY n=1 Tax=Kribbella shirazensis TaxID=1105143 RepID=A0A7X6A0M0_9ACTN|nr:WYL domain-containing protein [Kribbella shirazensis]NIK57123.1 putative DNA-binding transcriptional regulator YafY [Kribbella shirazensis]
MRAERLLRLLLHLQTRGQSTVAQLADALEVSPRTIQRDLDSLSLAGVPVYSIRGRGGGWTMLPDYRSRLTGLTPSEVMSVFVGATAHVLADLGLDASSELAVTKLIASLPEGTRREAEYARQRLLIDHAGWDDRRETPRWLDLCRQAVWEERTLEIVYGDLPDPGAPPDRPTPFPVEPLGLVAKTRTWYLVAARTDGRLRTYRLSRLTSAALTDRPFARPVDFDLAAYWAQSQQEFQASRPSYPITLKVRDHAVRRFRPTTPILPADDGWWILHTDLENPHEACAAVLAQAGNAQVVAPPELIGMVHEAATQIAAASLTGTVRPS